MSQGMQSMLNVPAVIEQLQQIANQLATLYTEYQKERESEKISPLLGNTINIAIDPKTGKPVLKITTGNVTPHFNPRLNRLSNVTTGLGYFGDRHPPSMKDFQNLKKLEDFMAFYFNLHPPKGGYIEARYHTIMSMFEIQSVTKDTQTPEALKRILSRAPQQEEETSNIYEAGLDLRGKLARREIR